MQKSSQKNSRPQIAAIKDPDNGVIYMYSMIVLNIFKEIKINMENIGRDQNIFFKVPKWYFYASKL